MFKGRCRLAQIGWVRWGDDLEIFISMPRCGDRDLQGKYAGIGEKSSFRKFPDGLAAKCVRHASLRSVQRNTRAT
jgi:hypothetical protein